MQTSERFERQVERIHKLLEASGAKVTWNNRIPDPDNPAQLRQIDITIHRDDKLTLVECRIHHKRQKVTWIEELIGRRQSLRADAVIAVSASGFTQGAISKAMGYGIILRDFATLTEEEIQDWGKSAHVAVIFHHFERIRLTFAVDVANYNREDLIDGIYNHLKRDRRAMYDLFEVISDALCNETLSDIPKLFQAEIELVKPIEIEGVVLDRLLFDAYVTRVTQQLRTPGVVAYDYPKTAVARRGAFIQSFDLENFEITHSSNQVVIAVDLSKLTTPANCYLGFLDIRFGREVTGQIEVLGLDKRKVKIEIDGLEISLRASTVPSTEGTPHS